MLAVAPRRRAERHGVSEQLEILGWEEPMLQWDGEMGRKGPTLLLAISSWRMEKMFLQTYEVSEIGSPA